MLPSYNFTSTSSIQDWHIGSPEILNSLNSEAFGRQRQIYAGYAQKDEGGHQPPEADVTGLGSQWQATWLFCWSVSPACHQGSLWGLVKEVFLSRTGWEVIQGQCHLSQQQRAAYRKAAAGGKTLPTYVSMGNDRCCNQVVVYLLDKEGIPPPKTQQTHS